MSSLQCDTWTETPLPDRRQGWNSDRFGVGHAVWPKPAEPISITCRDPVVGSRQVCVCPACDGFPGCGAGIYPSEMPDLSQLARSPDVTEPIEVPALWLPTR